MFAGCVVSAPRASPTRVFIGSAYAKTVAMQLRELGCNYEYLSPFVNYAEFDQYFSPIQQDLLTELDAALIDADSKRALQGIAAFRANRDPRHLIASAYSAYAHPQILLGDGSVVVDVGAWEGDTADHFLSRVGPNGRVVCVEPNQQAARKISRDPRVSVVSAGLWSYDTAGVLDRSSLERGGSLAGSEWPRVRLATRVRPSNSCDWTVWISIASMSSRWISRVLREKHFAVVRQQFSNGALFS